MFLIVFGCIGPLRAGGTNHDLGTFIDAGRALAAGMDPYFIQLYPTEPIGQALADGGLIGYPPNALPFLRLAALGAPGAVALVFQVMNLLAMGLIVRGCLIMARPRAGGQTAVMVLAVLANPLASHVIFMGQTSVIVAAAAIGAWFFTYQRRIAWLAGVLLSVACIKPTLAILIVLWLLLDRQWIVLGVAAALSAGYLVYAAQLDSPINLATYWLESAQHYAGQAHDSAGQIDRFGLTSLLATVNLDAPPGLIFGIPYLLLVWMIRRQLRPLNQLAVVCALTALTSTVHNYDLVLLSPLIAVIVLAASGSVARQLTGASLIFLLYSPQRFVVTPIAPMLAQWRVLVVLIMLAWVLPHTGRTKRRAAKNAITASRA